MGLAKSLARTVLFVGIAAVLAVSGWVVFIEYPGSLVTFLGVVLLVLVAPVIVKIAGSVTNSLFPTYNVAEVTVSGPITRSQGASPLGRGPTGADADRIVEQIERADGDSSVDALLVKLNTPGGEIVPSEDIKLAAEAFDGPTIGYATDTCASGGYEIASGCDELWAREGSIVGSIGVIGSRVNAADLAEKIGLEYEQFTAGDYKDAGTPLKELEDDEREYLQGLIDGYYDQFVEGIAQRRELTPEEIRDTEARIFLGTEALEWGLVDELGRREAVIDALEDQLGKPVTVDEFEPQSPLSQRLNASAQRLAFSFGAGIARTLHDGDRPLRFR
jgi:protease-4